MTSQELFKIRFSINMFSWFGKDLKNMTNGIIDVDEEEYLSNILPTKYNKKNLIFGDYCCVHYSFFTTRKYLNSEGILEMYKKILISVFS